jgi:indolepyruvate ferredoxin oxidoreductase
MLQKERDVRAGLNTAGYISGYRGSPLGGLDMALNAAKKHLAGHDIVFQPGVNEELAADALWGTQQVNLFAGARHDGVFGMWYGKGPGVDRAADALKHANLAGTSRHGGVLLLAGDDHACKSSTTAHQSEHLLIASGIPVLYPASVQEYLDYGLHGWAMSRYSGLWAGMKCVTDVVESSSSVELDPDRVQIVLPQDFALPPGGLNIRWPDPPLAQEARMLEHKWYAALAYVRANGLNRVVIDPPGARFGIMAAGKAYLDVRQALVDLGLDEAACRRIGIRLLKVGCVWPLDGLATRDFARGLDEILVVEEKRQVLEYALKEQLYDWRDDVRPHVVGKYDEHDGAGGEWSPERGQPLLPIRYELSPAIVARAIAARLERRELPAELQARIDARIGVIAAREREMQQLQGAGERKAWFCSGCPHNSSTKVPEGSRALAGIGCHYLVLGMERNTATYTQMGAEGTPWLGQMHFTDEKHVFVNLGDGTYFHSGLLAIRAAIAAKANMTYKILYNDAVAMTGGQPVDGVMTVPQIVQQVLGEGASRVVVVSDEPQKYGRHARLPAAVTVHHRNELDTVQRELRETPGTTVLIYDQICATEKRRRRKRGRLPAAERRAFINDTVCEGCGDCSTASNCLSVEPLQTALGTKRRINQSSCNVDLSCVNGFCPSFVTAEGARPRQPGGAGHAAPEPARASLVEPALPALDEPCRIVITGVGGTGVVTIGALLGMAAHLEGKGVTVMDVTGLAQKGGCIRARIATGEARLLLGCDIVVAVSEDALSKTAPGYTQALINTGRSITGEFLRNPDRDFPDGAMEQVVADTVGREATQFIAATRLATRLMGHSIATNIFMLGHAFQRGLIPLSAEAILRAIELNGAAVEDNLRAFDWGRRAAHDPAAIAALLGDEPAPPKPPPPRWTKSLPAAATGSSPSRTKPMRSATSPWSIACAWPSQESALVCPACLGRRFAARQRRSPKPSPATTTGCWPTRTNSRWRACSPSPASARRWPPASKATTDSTSTSPCPGRAAPRPARSRRRSVSAPGCCRQ